MHHHVDSYWNLPQYLLNLDVFLADYCSHSQWRFSICSNSIAIVGILWRDEQSPIASAIESMTKNIWQFL